MTIGVLESPIKGGTLEEAAATMYLRVGMPSVLGDMTTKRVAARGNGYNLVGESSGDCGVHKGVTHNGRWQMSRWRVHCKRCRCQMLGVMMKARLD